MPWNMLSILCGMMKQMSFLVVIGPKITGKIVSDKRIRYQNQMADKTVIIITHDVSEETLAKYDTVIRTDAWGVV